MRNEAIGARTWEKNYNFLINDDRKKLLKRVDDERRRERLAVRCPPPSENGLFMNEISIFPEPPQRITEKDRYYMKQTPGRHNSNSKMLKYYYTYSLPPNKSDSHTKKDMTHEDLIEINRKFYTLQPNSTYEPTSLYKCQHKEDESFLSKNASQTVSSTMDNTSSRVTIHGFNLTNDSPKNRFDNRKTLTSHDYGWCNTLEYNKYGKSIFHYHGKRGMVFD